MNNYQTGTAADINVLLSTLGTWLTGTVGYTQNMAPTALGSGLRAHYQITTPRGNTLYVNFRSWRKEVWNAANMQTGYAVNYLSSQAVDGLMMNLSKAYTGGGVMWDIQGGQATSGDNYYQALSVHAGAYNNISAYHFFHLTNPHMICVVLEWQLGWFSHLVWGEPDSSGAGVFNPNNGYFYYGSSPNYTPFNNSTYNAIFPDTDNFYHGLRSPESYYQQCRLITQNNTLVHNVYFQLDPTLHTGANGWLGPPDQGAYNTRNSTHNGTAYNGTNAPGLYVGNNFDSDIYRLPKPIPYVNSYSPARRSVNDAAGVTVFFPIQLFWMRNYTGAVYLGSFPEMYMVNLKTFSPNQTLTMGADQYIVFPYGFKPNPFTYNYSTGTPTNRLDRNHGMGVAIKLN